MLNFADFRCFNCKKVLRLAKHGFCNACIQQIYLSKYENLKIKQNKMIFAGAFTPPLKSWIINFKNNNQYFLDYALARLLLLKILEAKRTQQITMPEIILPVPLFWQKQLTRGFNQAELIAKNLAHWLNIPLDCDSLTRIQAGQIQRSLTRKERFSNVSDLFHFVNTKNYRSVAIVDDVVTTGATIKAISEILENQGVKQIQVWALARAVNE